jgi:hypothetical protein
MLNFGSTVTAKHRPIPAMRTSDTSENTDEKNGKRIKTTIAEAFQKPPCSDTKQFLEITLEPVNLKTKSLKQISDVPLLTE